MALKGKCTVVVKTTKMVLKVNKCVKKEVHYRGVQKRHSRRYSDEEKPNCLFVAPPVNCPPRKNSSIESTNTVQALDSLFSFDLSFISVLPLNQWCRKKMAIFIQGGGGGGSTIPIIGASFLINLWVVLSVCTLRLTLIIHQHWRTCENCLHS
ncbi:hypothetical protein H5410_061340 [Solanum commersonii]|uniref:Uncharacterized protein n=1 Tax=Solanum commersonii TaxID=4109 RepID=A0A9J5W9B8_SOLCO|nr:hypothetical protein H5410_061340 [Solanum commersonii]